MNTTDNAPALPPLPSFTDFSTQSLRDDFKNYGLACYEAGRASRDAVRVPEGMVLVPREPTEEMLLNASKWVDFNPDGGFDAWPSDIYRAMLASAPSATSLAEPPHQGADALREALADRLDALADSSPLGSQEQSDLYAAATVWRKHIHGGK